MVAEPFGVFQPGVAGLEIALVCGHGLADGERAPRLDFADGVIAARELASDLGRFPKRQDRGAVALLVVIGEREALQPRAARPVGFEDGPHAAALISAIGEPDAERDA